MNETFGRSLSKLRSAWRYHKSSAKQRGVVFKLSFEVWLRIWIDSGKLEKRGCRKGQYVMARFGDKGAYTVGNVVIVPQEENHRESLLGKPKTTSHKLNLSKACIGRPSAFKGKRHTENSLKLLRKPKTEQHKKKLAEAARRRWAQHV